jgi:hypothetical protein
MEVLARLVQTAICLALLIPADAFAQSAATKPTGQIQKLKVTVLSTMLVGETKGIGEWGFSALV